MKNKKVYNKKAKATIAVTQILILVIATIAFSCMIGGEVKVVSAADSGGTTTPSSNPCVGSYCYANKLYGGKLVNEKCVTDTNNLKQDCPDGCTNGLSTCNIKTNPPSETTPADKTTGKDVEGYVTTGIGVVDMALRVAEYIKKIKTGAKIGGAGSQNMIGDWIPGSNNLAGNAGVHTNPITTSGGKTNLLKSLFGNGGSNFVQILRNAGWAAVTLFAISLIAKTASARNRSDIMTASYIGAGLGMAAATIWALLATEAGTGPPGWLAAAATAVAYVGYMLTGYQLYSREIFTFRSGLWQPTTQAVGSDCNKCNLLTVGSGDNEVSGCSNYVCHSYGTACEWVNNATKYETCIETNIGDKAAPVITPAKEIYGENVFPNSNYDYKTSAVGSSIIYSSDGAGTGQCVPAFSPVKLAFKTNENAECRIIYGASASGTTSLEKFDAMKDLLEGTAYVKNHTLILPALVTASQASLENAGYELTNGGVYKFFIRCKDVRGNINTADYQMSFCVQNGPDTNPPSITKTNPSNGTFIPYYTINETDSKPYPTVNITDFRVYTNEPADCKWDNKKVSYNLMAYSMTGCSQSINELFEGFDFGCITNLTGFKSGQENKYYIACTDQPELKGTAQESKRNKGAPYEVTLIGTSKLLIQSVTINGNLNGTKVRGAEDEVPVKIEITTTGGAEDGNSRCSYSEDKVEPRVYSAFDNEGSRIFLTPNSQTLYMSSGIYTFFIQCLDVAQNSAVTMINFSVETDRTPPVVVRVYRDEETDTLKLITDEKAECVYNNYNSECSYVWENGTVMDTEDGMTHSTSWDINKDFYIKCRNEFGIMPLSGCSIIARPFEIFQLQ
jgi:hypothetical protein